MQVVLNWVPSSIVELKKTAKMDIPRLSKYPIQILAIGRLSSQKGFDILIHAVHLLKKEGYDIHLKIIGDGLERQPLLALCRKLGLSSNIEFTGKVEDSQKINLIQSVDIFAVPSRFEGLPLTILEAMYLGKPVVGTEIGAIKEVITNGYNGILAQPNAKSLASAIKSVMVNPSFSDNLSQNGKETVQEKFSHNNCLYTVAILERMS
jgi:glycosyltransferase involved in cell wall biosynthesis